MTELFIGVDLGTTRTKTGLVDARGELITTLDVATPWLNSDEGPVLNIDRYGEMVDRLILDVAAAAADKGGTIAGIGITGMGETGALLAPDGTAKAPGYAWHHSLGDVDKVQSDLGEEAFKTTTGHGLDLAPSIIKLAYLRDNGVAFAPGDTWLNLPEYIAWRLTGNHSTELSLAGRTGLFDLRRKTWWSDAVDYLGLPEGFLPEVPVTGSTPVGGVRGYGETLEGAPVVAAGHDHPVAAIAGALDRKGPLVISLGTSEAHIRLVDPTLTDGELLELVDRGVTVDWHPGGDYWYVLSTLPTGLTLERLARLLGAGTREERLALSESALAAKKDPRVQMRNVTLDSFDITGLHEATSRATLWRRAVEDLVDAAEAHIAQVSAVVGEPEEKFIFGGWSHDPLVREERARRGQHVRDGMPIEPGLVGAAISAAHAAGMELPYLP